MRDPLTNIEIDLRKLKKKKKILIHFFLKEKRKSLMGPPSVLKKRTNRENQILSN